MIFQKLRLYTVGLVAVLLGMPLTEKAFAGAGNIANTAISGAFAIWDSADQS